jgi:hypothetical protein
MKLPSFGVLFALSTATVVLAGTPAPFLPLPANGGNSTVESTAPFLLPPDFTQQKITDRNTLRADPDFARTFGTWDMLALDPSGRYVFIPFEVARGAGLGRYDRASGDFVAALTGNNTGRYATDPSTWKPDDDDFGTCDPALWTPNGTVLTAEEGSGAGRVFEWLNPLMEPGDVARVRWLPVPGVSHEGLRFGADGTLYFIDERNSGSLYKYVPVNPADLGGGGQSFVLSDDDFVAAGGRAWEDWNSGANAATDRTGPATWVPVTDISGNPLPGLPNPFTYGRSDDVSRGGQAVANHPAVNGTPYGRPEDLDISRLANGNEVVFMAVTSEHAVYSIELIDSTHACVRAFVTRDTMDAAHDRPVGSQLTNPDNLAVGPNGEVYVVEDQGTGGDIWAATDADDDGIAESLGRMASLGIRGDEEPSGWILDPNDRDTFLVCVQHPSSGNDAIWAITAPWDLDGDNVVDPKDLCPESDLSPTVVVKGRVDSGVANVLYADGCSLADLVNGLAGISRNHGQFVSAVAHLASELLTGSDQAALKRSAAQSR